MTWTILLALFALNCTLVPFLIYWHGQAWASWEEKSSLEWVLAASLISLFILAHGLVFYIEDLGL